MKITLFILTRPKAIEVLNHPLFWDAEKRLSFLHDTSDRVGENSYLLKALERTAHTAFGTKLKGKVVLTWDNMVDDKIIRHMSSCLERNYKFSSVRDLLRLIRNMLTHYAQLDQDIQVIVNTKYMNHVIHLYTCFKCFKVDIYLLWWWLIQILVGSLYDGFEDYFTSRFPMLLMEVYKVLCMYYGEEKYCRKYFMGIYSGEMDTRFWSKYGYGLFVLFFFWLRTWILKQVYICVSHCIRSVVKLILNWFTIYLLKLGSWLSVIHCTMKLH